MILLYASPWHSSSYSGTLDYENNRSKDIRDKVYVDLEDKQFNPFKIFGTLRPDIVLVSNNSIVTLELTEGQI